MLMPSVLSCLAEQMLSAAVSTDCASSSHYDDLQQNSERRTRIEVIDLRLKNAGWDVSDLTQVVPEYFVPHHTEEVIVSKSTRESTGLYASQREFSDYVLLGRNGKPLAVVEAKIFEGRGYRQRAGSPFVLAKK